ncbi:uncharacterized protein [Eurosta solidaginis]|uniref:uncharacterized protein n=1 Tax=Eurosta solidaginis TaxID=178769 RepID=UPI003530658D
MPLKKKKFTSIKQIVTYNEKRDKMYNTTPLLEYNHYKHRCRVKAARKYIDDSAPILHLTTIMNLKNNYSDLVALSHNMRDNIDMLEYFGRMNLIGRKNSWNNSHDAQWRYSRLVSMHKSVQAIERENQFIARRIQDARKVIDTNLKPKSVSNPSLKRKSSFKAPHEILSKYDNRVHLPNKCSEERLLLRPIVYFELEVVGLCSIGRFTVQLYTEALPQVVLAFVRTCKEGKLRRLTLVRSFTDLWAEFELKLDVKDIEWAKEAPIEYDRRALHQNIKSGVLSFSLKHVETLRKGILSFALSFRPLVVDMKDRVAFGKLIDGMRGLYLLESNGTKNGKPMKNVIATAMGVER